MKKNRSLRSMIFFLAVVLIIPILCFTLYLQVQTWRTMKHNLQRELEGELNTANHMLEMVIDKYDMVLYDFCTDDEIIELVEQINESEKPSDAVKISDPPQPGPYLQPECRSGGDYPDHGIRYGLFL